MPTVFMSYSWDDVSYAEQLEADLKGVGINVWRDQQKLYGGLLWPKELGEAIAAQDAILLLWSGKAADSHFVEFEWTTSIALKIPIIPCLIDTTPLPPALRAIQAVQISPIESCVQQILTALKAPQIGKSRLETSRVIDALATIAERDPVEVICHVRAIFSQQGWTVQGNVYQAAGDIIIQQGGEKKEKEGIDLWVKIVGLIAAFLGIVISCYTIKDHLFTPKKQTAVIETKPQAHKIPLRGIVRTSPGEAISDATVSLNSETGRSITTTSDGGFYFANISGVSGDRVRIYVKKPGYRNHNEYVSLPGPARIVIEKK
jgi:hypothetical protein